MRRHPGKKEWMAGSYLTGMWGILPVSLSVFLIQGCSSMQLPQQTHASDPLLGPPSATPAKQKPAVASLQAPPNSNAPSTPAPTRVLPAPEAPNSTTSIAALAGSTDRPSSERDELRIGSPKTGNQSGSWGKSGGNVANAKAVLQQPETPSPAPTPPAPAILTKGTTREPAAESDIPPPPVLPSRPKVAAADTTPPSTVEAVLARLQEKGMLWKTQDQNTDGEWRFQCGIPLKNTGSTFRVRTYAGRAKDLLSAMQAVLEQVDKDQ